MIEWMDVAQPGEFLVEEDKWHQVISFGVDGVKMEVEVTYGYEEAVFHFSPVHQWESQWESTVREDGGALFGQLQQDPAFCSFLTNQKRHYDAVRPYLTNPVQIAELSFGESSPYGRDVRFTLSYTGSDTESEPVWFRAYLTKQLDWSLDELVSEIGGHTLRDAYLGTDLENQITAQLIRAVS